ncbi:MAG: phage antirepressor KilAC domain-containing protein [Oscillospiraceae bacterium]|nr:phage antirepressor KilAC domain-containing protein [Oscillospiraceae bacterium]
MDEMKVFEHEEFGQVRTVMINGEPWFVGKDIAESLGYKNASRALAMHVAIEDKGISKCYTLGGMQSLLIINESGLYSLILGSKKLEAKAFKRWVTSEILPSLQKYGFYARDEVLENFLSDPETAIRTFTALKEERDKNRALTEENRILTEKCSYLDLIIGYTDAVPITVIAKDYGMSGREMNRLLHNLGVQFQLQCGTWVLYQKYANHGYTRSRTIVYDDVHCRSAVHTYWTQRGRLFLYEFLKERGHLPLCEKGGDADEDSGM